LVTHQRQTKVYSLYSIEAGFFFRSSSTIDFIKKCQIRKW